MKMLRSKMTSKKSLQKICSLVFECVLPSETANFTMEKFRVDARSKYLFFATTAVRNKLQTKCFYEKKLVELPATRKKKRIVGSKRRRRREKT